MVHNLQADISLSHFPRKLSNFSVVLWALPSVHVSSESKAFGNPCYHQFDVDTQNTSFTAEADKTTKVIRFSVDYKVHTSVGVSETRAVAFGSACNLGCPSCLASYAI